MALKFMLPCSVKSLECFPQEDAIYQVLQILVKNAYTIVYVISLVQYASKVFADIFMAQCEILFTF